MNGEKKRKIAMGESYKADNGINMEMGGGLKEKEKQRTNAVL